MLEQEIVSTALEHRTRLMTVGDIIRHKISDITKIPIKVQFLIDLGTVKIPDPDAYILNQMRRAWEEIDELEGVDPSLDYYGDYLGLKEMVAEESNYLKSGLPVS